MSWEVLARYAEEQALPSLVQRAVEASRAAGVDQACLPEVGRFLQVLAAIPEDGRLAELGTAGGIGAAWLASGMRAGSTLVTVERDPHRVAVSGSVLGGVPGVSLLEGDWSLAAAGAPYDLLFADGGPKREPDAPDLLAVLLRPGGMLVFDDLTPGVAAAGDALRQLWFQTPRFHAVELALSPAMAVLLAVRRG